jgi:hypothetical protein
MYQSPQTIKNYLVQSEYVRQLVFLLSVVIGIGLLYSLVPTNFSAVRGALAFAQFVFMAITMYITALRILEDF